MDYDTKIEGIPVYHTTRTNSVFTKKIKTDKMIVVELDTKTLDLPMSDTHVIHESWVIM
jgi:hypothetical protein